MHIISIVKLRTFAKEISMTQHQCGKNALINEEALKEKMKNAFLHLSLYIILLQSGLSLTTIGVFKQGHYVTNASEWGTNALIITYIAFSFIMLAPKFTFGIVYFNLTNILCVWCDEIKNNKSNLCILQETKYFIEGLNNVSNHFAEFLFWIISLFQVAVIFLGYVTIFTIFAFINEDSKCWEIYLFHNWTCII